MGKSHNDWRDWSPSVFYSIRFWTRPLLNKNADTRFLQKTFFKNSYALLYYYITILLICLLNRVYPIYNDIGLYMMGGHFFWYKMFDERIIGSLGYHFWFISTIIQFYIAFPLIIKIKKKISVNKFALLSISISLTYWTLISIFDLSHLRVFNSFFLQYLWEFNIGIVLAERYLSNGELFWNKSGLFLWIFSTAGIGLMATMGMKCGRLGQTFNDIPAAMGYLALASLIYLIVSNTSIIVNTFVYIGKISYEIYLTHMFFFILLNEFLIKSIFSEPDIFTSLFIILPISIFAAKYYSSAIDFVIRFLKSRLNDFVKNPKHLS